VYQVEGGNRLLQTGRRILSHRHAVSANVVFLGLTSLFTDISSEIVTGVLPLYVLTIAHLSPMAFGVVDGLYLGAASLIRLPGGLLADWTRRYKGVAVAGYALSMLSRAGLLAFGSSLGWLLGVVVTDRIGKGIRSDSRDAMISFSTPPAELATAFGVHRALDTTGAMLGPLIAFGVLMIAPHAYDAVFAISLCAALIGLGILVLFVEDRRAPGAAANPSAVVSMAGLLQLARSAHVRRLIVAAGALNLTTISDAFLYLTLQRRLDFAVGFFPLLYVGTSAAYMMLALPVGLLADRIGRGRVFMGSYLLLLAAYSSLLLPPAGGAAVVGYVALLGAYYAGTDGVLMALASARLPEHQRATGMALLMTVTSLARLTASILFGWLWTWRGVEVAVVTFGSGLAAAIIVTWLFLERSPDTRHEVLAAS
jgi:MFS family permease